MKLLYLNALYHPHVGGGAEITLKLIVDGMRSRGHEVIVLTTGPGPGLERDTVDGASVIRLPIANFFWPHGTPDTTAGQRIAWHLRDIHNSAMARLVRDQVRALRPDVASCHNLSGLSAAVWDALADEGVPIVQVLHDHYLRCPRSVMYKADRACATPCLSCRAFRWRHPQRSRRVGAVVGISRFMLEGIVADGWFDGALQRVIHNARFVPAVPPPPPRSRLTFGFIGKLTPIKGIEWLLQAFAESGVDAELIVAGQGLAHYEATLRSQHGSDRVRFVGYSAASAFYRHIDVCVVPSLCPEALGMVAIEAAAHGLPVIASNRGGLPESIHHEVNGLVCDADRPSSLVEALRRMADDARLRQRLAAQARASVAHFIDVDRMLDAYEALYATLAPAAAPAALGRPQAASPGRP